MNREQLKAAVRRELSEARYEHTLRVEETALQLGERFGTDRKQTEQAALLHDYCKCWPYEKLRKKVTEFQLEELLLPYHVAVWHAFVGAEVVKRDLGVDNDDVLNAIRFHTTGRAGMSTLEKVICLADIIEPGRDFPGVEDIRALACHDLDRALLLSFDQTLVYLIGKGSKLHPLTIAARNDLLDQVNG